MAYMTGKITRAWISHILVAELENMLTETLGKITKKLDVVSTR